MKKLALIAGLMFINYMAEAVERPGKNNDNVVINAGTSLNFVKNVVGSTGTVVLSTGTSTRAHVTCINTGSFNLFITTASISTGGLGSGFVPFYVGEGTSTLNSYNTFGTATLFAIAPQGQSGTLTVYCAEEL